MAGLFDVLERDIAGINGCFAAHHVDAGTMPGLCIVAGGSFVVYELALGLGVRVEAVERLRAELSEALSKARGVPTPVRFRYMPLALELAHPAPAPLRWSRVKLGGLQPGSMLAGRAYLAGGGVDQLIDLDRSPHVLVAGMTRSGKSTLAAMLALSFALSTPPASVEYWLIDLKNEDVTALRSLPHVRALAVDRAQAADLVGRLHAEKDRRVAAGRGDFRRIVLIIDELAELAPVPGALDLLGSIVSVGASKRINVIACTQKPTAAVVGSIAKSNFTTRLCGRVADATEAATATGRRDTGAELLPGFGAFLRVEGVDVVRLQTFLLSPVDVDSLIGWARDRWGSSASATQLQAQLPAVPAGLVVNGAPVPAGLLTAVGASAPVVRPPVVDGVDVAPASGQALPFGVSPALAAVFAQYYNGEAGGLRYGGMAASLVVLVGPDYPKTGRPYQAAQREVLGRLDSWLKAGAPVVQGV